MGKPRAVALLLYACFVAGFGSLVKAGLFNLSWISILAIFICVANVGIYLFRRRRSDSSDLLENTDTTRNER